MSTDTTGSTEISTEATIPKWWTYEFIGYPLNGVITIRPPTPEDIHRNKIAELNRRFEEANRCRCR